MKYRISSKSDLCARFVVATVGLALAVTACDDSEDRVDLGSGGSKAGTGSGGKNSAGSGGKNNAGSAGKNTAGSLNVGGAGGDSSPEGGAAGDSALGGVGGEPTGEAGGAGEGGQGGAPSEDNVQALFVDDYGADISFVPFGGSTNDVTVDATTSHSGTASLKIAVPAAGYTGGALVSATELDLSKYNAVSFWAKASVANTLNVVGLGNDAAAGSPLPVERTNLALTTDWQHFVVPVPWPSKLTAENGLFHFAEGAETATYSIWLDDIEYVVADNLGTPAPSIPTETRSITIGDTFPIAGASVLYTIDAVPLTVTVGAAWFDYLSLDEGVASVTAGVVTAEGVGSTTVTADLDGVMAGGTLTINVAEVTVPEVAAPTPVNLPADVISLFSDAFTNVPVDTWSAVWDVADLADLTVAGNATKVYTGLSYAGVEFTTTVVDATAMTHFHVDVWMPTATVFKVKLVDFGANGAYAGGDDSEFEVARTGLTTKAWQSLEIPLADFTGLAARAHLAQMIIASEPGATVYFDNVYFHK